MIFDVLADLLSAAPYPVALLLGGALAGGALFGFKGALAGAAIGFLIGLYLEFSRRPVVRRYRLIGTIIMMAGLAALVFGLATHLDLRAIGR